MDYHVLENDKSHGTKDTITIVFHFPVPDINNESGVNYRTALKKQLAGKAASADTFQYSIVPELEATDLTEYNNLVEGVILEHRTTIRVDKNATPAQKLQKVVDEYNATQTPTLNKKKGELEYYGKEANV